MERSRGSRGRSSGRSKATPPTAQARLAADGIVVVRRSAVTEEALEALQRDVDRVVPWKDVVAVVRPCASAEDRRACPIELEPPSLPVISPAGTVFSFPAILRHLLPDLPSWVDEDRPVVEQVGRLLERAVAVADRAGTCPIQGTRLCWSELRLVLEPVPERASAESVVWQQEHDAEAVSLDPQSCHGPGRVPSGESSRALRQRARLHLFLTTHAPGEARARRADGREGLLERVWVLQRAERAILRRWIQGAGDVTLAQLQTARDTSQEALRDVARARAAAAHARAASERWQNATASRASFPTLGRSESASSSEAPAGRAGSWGASRAADEVGGADDEALPNDAEVAALALKWGWPATLLTDERVANDWVLSRLGDVREARSWEAACRLAAALALRWIADEDEAARAQLRDPRGGEEGEERGRVGGEGEEERGRIEREGEEGERLRGSQALPLSAAHALSGVRGRAAAVEVPRAWVREGRVWYGSGCGERVALTPWAWDVLFGSAKEEVGEEFGATVRFPAELAVRCVEVISCRVDAWVRATIPYAGRLWPYGSTCFVVDVDLRTVPWLDATLLETHPAMKAGMHRVHWRAMQVRHKQRRDAAADASASESPLLGSDPSIYLWSPSSAPPPPAPTEPALFPALGPAAPAPSDTAAAATTATAAPRRTTVWGTPDPAAAAAPSSASSSARAKRPGKPTVLLDTSAALSSRRRK